MLKKKQKSIKQSLFVNEKTSCFLIFSSIQKILFKVMFIFLALMCLSCRYNPKVTNSGSGGGGVDNVGNIPGGQIIEGCNNSDENPNYNACIYKKNPIAQSGNAIDRNGNVLSQLTDLQTFAVQITDTEGDMLKNSHFDIDIGDTGNIGNIGIIDTMVDSIVDIDIGTLIISPSYLDPKAHVVERVKLSEGKWTTPYSDGDYSVEQVMSYYWLMYQHDWMKENASGFYASEKGVKVTAFSANPFEAYFSPLENKIALGLICDINSLSCDPPVGVGLSAEIAIHELGHANASHSVTGLLREGLESGCQTHVACGSRKSLCDLADDEILEASRCCPTEKGCFFAVDEGQADFHAAVLFPNSTVVGEMFQNSTQGISGCFPGGGLSRSAADSTTKNANAQQVFNNCTNHKGPGEIHLMGVLYNSIWWEVYKHENTEESDILKLFTEHLPILHFDDTFETAGARIINLAKQLFDGLEGNRYADIIQNEFNRRGLSTAPDESL